MTLAQLVALSEEHRAASDPKRKNKEYGSAGDLMALARVGSRGG